MYVCVHAYRDVYALIGSGITEPQNKMDSSTVASLENFSPALAYTVLQ